MKKKDINTKEYIEEQYKLALSDFILAKSEEGQWQVRKTMARLLELASNTYGFEYADELQRKFLIN